MGDKVNLHQGRAASLEGELTQAQKLANELENNWSRPEPENNKLSTS